MGKCKFHKKCAWYAEDSATCNFNDGMYYNDLEDPAGCYIRMQELEDKQ